jgi:competence protein ComEC
VLQDAGIKLSSVATRALGASGRASNGFLVALLEWVARTASALPFATVATSGVTLPLIWLFYVGCVPAAIAERAFPEERWVLWAALLVAWTALWVALVGVGSV